MRNMHLTKLGSEDNLICVAPQISSSIRVLWAAEGGNVLIPCPHSGEPPPQIQWLFHGTPMPNTSLVSNHRL